MEKKAQDAANRAKEAANKIIQIAQTNVNIETKYSNNDNSNYIPDISLCVNELELSINYNTEDTFRRATEWFKLLK